MDHILSSKALDLIGFFFFLVGGLKSVKVIIMETRCFAMTQANLALVNCSGRYVGWPMSWFA